MGLNALPLTVLLMVRPKNSLLSDVSYVYYYISSKRCYKMFRMYTIT